MIYCTNANDNEVEIYSFTKNHPITLIGFYLKYPFDSQ